MGSLFLGSGWKFPVNVDEEGYLQIAQYEQSIQDAIWLILATAPGERVMRPDFGCGIHDLVFAPNSAATATRIAGEVRMALLKWEPRIDVLAVEATPAGNGEILYIQIDYKVRTSNNRFNLVYPFYLAEGVEQ